MQEERWKEDPKTGFLVSDWGRVKNVQTGRLLGARSYSPGADSPYIHVHHGTGRGSNNLVHHMVWRVWGDRPRGDLDVCHRDGRRDNNRITNLYLASRSINKLCGPNLHANRSGYRNVSAYNNNRRWKWTATPEGVRHGRAGFFSPEDAAKDRDDWLVDTYGELVQPAALNFPRRHFTDDQLAQLGWSEELQPNYNK